MKNFLIFISFCVLGAIIGGPIGFTIGLVIGVLVWIGSNKSPQANESPPAKQVAQASVGPKNGTPASLTEEQAKTYRLSAANLYAWMFSFFGDGTPSKATALREILERDTWLPNIGAVLSHISAKMGQLRLERIQSPMQSDLWIQGLIAQIKEQDELILDHLCRHLRKIIPLAEGSMPLEAISLLRSLHPKLQVQQAVASHSELAQSGNTIPKSSSPILNSIPAIPSQGTGMIAAVPKPASIPKSLVATVAGAAGVTLLADAVRASQRDAALQGSLEVTPPTPTNSGGLMSEAVPFPLENANLSGHTIEERAFPQESEQILEDNSIQEPNVPSDSTEIYSDQTIDFGSISDSVSDSLFD